MAEQALQKVGDGAVVTVPEAVSLLSIIERASRDPSVDIDKMERLMQMHERLVAKQSETAFNVAMTECQEEMRRISADATNPQTHSQYASYGRLDQVLRPIYTKRGFSLTFSDGETTKLEHVRVVCLVRHIGGHKETHWKDMPADGKGAKGGDVMTKTHAAGAAQQYGMRYLLKGIFNVAIGENDNDGNGETECITPEQVQEFDGLIKDAGANKASFLAWLKAKSLEEIPATAYKGAKEMLEAKKKQAAKSAKNASTEFFGEEDGTGK